MKELAVLLISWLIRGNNGNQIIFPDEYELIKNSYANGYGNNNPPRAVVANPIAVTTDAVNGLSAVANDGPNFLGSSSTPITNTAEQPYDAEAQYWSNHVNNLLSRGVSKFSLDMNRAIYRSLGDARTSKNVIFSPLSLVSTLAMVLLGSAGVTFEQVARILGLESGVDITSHSEIVHQMLGLLLESIDAKTDSLGPQINTASGIFVQNGYPIRREFMEISQQVYKNEVINLDFMGQPSKATKTVNDWVKERTRGKISGILNHQVDPNTKLIIASALYFSGEWNRYFFPRGTQKKPFMVTPNESVQVDMMLAGGKFPFHEDKQLGMKIIGLPYKGHGATASNEFSTKFPATMYVLMPTAKDADALNRLEGRLTPENIEELIGKMVNRTCTLGLPRMKISSNLNLNEALESLGLSSLFDPRTSNLGLLSPGYNKTTPSIFTRVGVDEDENATAVDGVTRPVNPVVAEGKRNRRFRYEDKRGGYSVEQWDSGVLIQKINSSYHRKRSADVQDNGPTRETASYGNQLDNDTTDARLRYIAIGDDKYKFETPTRSKRQQSRPIDENFVRFIKSRQILPQYGLDALRNSPNLSNPGLFASDVLHKVEMDITETGTVAAATTAILFQRGGDIRRFFANRPFLFFIRHEYSKLILFWGTVNKPTPNY